MKSCALPFISQLFQTRQLFLTSPLSKKEEKAKVYRFLKGKCLFWIAVKMLSIVLPFQKNGESSYPAVLIQQDSRLFLPILPTFYRVRESNGRPLQARKKKCSSKKMTVGEK